MNLSQVFLHHSCHLSGRLLSLLVVFLISLTAPLTEAKVTDPTRFNWKSKASDYSVSESSAGKNGVLFVTRGRDKVAVKLFAAGESDPLLPQILQHELLEEADIVMDAPIVAYRKADAKTQKDFTAVEKKLLELLAADSKQRKRIADGIVEIRITPFLKSYATGLDCDSIAGIHNLPVREITLANGKTDVEFDFRRKKQQLDGNALATDAALRLNDQLDYLNAYLVLLSKAGSKKSDPWKTLGEICAIDALVGNEDRGLKGGFKNWGNVMLIESGKGSKRVMDIAAIDNGGTCIDRQATAQAAISVSSAPKGAPEKEKWLAAIWAGYLDRDAGFASVNLKDAVDSSPAIITADLKASLLNVLDGFRHLHAQGKLLPAGRTNVYGADRSEWKLTPAVRVDPIAQGTMDKKGTTAPRDSGEFVYAKKAIEIDWTKVEQSIAEGFQQGVAEISEMAGGAEMMEPGHFEKEALGKAVNRLLKAHLGSGQKAGDELSREMLLLRAYYLHLRVVDGLTHQTALPKLANAAEKLALIQ